MIADDVAEYLKNHPEFFENYAEMLAEINIPHPHGGRTIPISERQILTLRERSKQMEAKLREMVQFGEENDAISERTHRLALALLGAKDLAAVAHAIEFSLREDFAVPHVALRVWRGSNHEGGHALFSALPNETRQFAAQLDQPRCSAQTPVDTVALFGDAASQLKSFAYITLRDREPFGMVAMASEDAQRFYPDMGTLFLTRLGDLMSAAIARHLV